MCDDHNGFSVKVISRILKSVWPSVSFTSYFLKSAISSISLPQDTDEKMNTGFIILHKQTKGFAERPFVFASVLVEGGKILHI